MLIGRCELFEESSLNIFSHSLIHQHIVFVLVSLPRAGHHVDQSWRHHLNVSRVTSYIHELDAPSFDKSAEESDRISEDALDAMDVVADADELTRVPFQLFLGTFDRPLIFHASSGWCVS